MYSRNWIGGEWLTPSGKAVVVHNPSDLQEEIGLVTFSGADDTLSAGESAKHALAKWGSMTGAQRGEYLTRVATLLQQRREEIARLASSEMGKPINEMMAEVTRGIDILHYYAAEGVRNSGNVIPASQNRVLQYTKRTPLGVVGIITPWNFPVAIPLWKIAPALICGNTIVWKPSEIASLTATRLAELFAEAQFPAGVLNMVIGDGTVGSTLLEKVDLDGVSFTGSSTTGEYVASICARRNIKFQTEMGGKNAAVVLGDADLSKTIPALISGAYRSAGQKCTGTSRIIVEKSIYNSLVGALRQGIREIQVGSALDPTTYVGPVASDNQYKKVMSYVELAKQEAHIVAQGEPKIDLKRGYYIPPQVVSNVEVTHPLVQEEIFGPITTLLTVDDFDAAVDATNRTVYGLSASVFTQDLSKAMRFLDEAQAGMVRVNLETAGVEYQAPFGGMKQSSSHTREQGQTALDFYSQIKTCAVFYG